MGDADFADAAAFESELDQEFGGEERASGLDPDRLQRPALEQFAGAVDVVDADAKEDPVGEAVDAGVPAADRRIGPLQAESDHDVRCVGLGHAGRQAADVDHPELTIAVDECDQLEPGGAEAGSQGRSVAQVGGVMDDAEDVRVPPGEVVGDGGRPVFRAVVDRDHFEPVGQGRKGGQRLVDQGFEVGLLVVRREEERQSGDSGRRGGFRRRGNRRVRLPGNSTLAHFAPFLLMTCGIV